MGQTILTVVGGPDHPSGVTDCPTGRRAVEQLEDLVELVVGVTDQISVEIEVLPLDLRGYQGSEGCADEQIGLLHGGLEIRLKVFADGRGKLDRRGGVGGPVGIGEGHALLVCKPLVSLPVGILRRDVAAVGEVRGVTEHVVGVDQ